MNVAWQAWLTQPGRFNLLSSSALKCKVGTSVGGKYGSVGWSWV